MAKKKEKLTKIGVVNEFVINQDELRFIQQDIDCDYGDYDETKVTLQRLSDGKLKIKVFATYDEPQTYEDEWII
jgi:hypothetical protein